MSFYKQRYTYAEALPLIKKLKNFLARYASALINEEDPSREWFFYGDKSDLSHRRIFNELVLFLEAGNFVKMAPTEGGIFIIFDKNAEGSTPTTSNTHFRFPKLSTLITLTSEDFFAYFRILAAAHNTASPDTLVLQPSIAGIPSLATSALAPFFNETKTATYRLADEYSDRKWTPRDAAGLIGSLEPTTLNQLYAMQYLTAIQNPDLLYFPIETMVELELDWQQVSEDYCVPPDTSDTRF